MPCGCEEGRGVHGLLRPEAPRPLSGGGGAGSVCLGRAGRRACQESPGEGMQVKGVQGGLPVGN